MKYNLSATWRAITSFSIEQFPMFLPKVHPIAAFFILRRLKHMGYSDCRVSASGNGLVVHAVK